MYPFPQHLRSRCALGVAGARDLLFTSVLTRFLPWTLHRQIHNCQQPVGQCRRLNASTALPGVPSALTARCRCVCLFAIHPFFLVHTTTTPHRSMASLRVGWQMARCCCGTQRPLSTALLATTTSRAPCWPRCSSTATGYACNTVQQDSTTHIVACTLAHRQRALRSTATLPICWQVAAAMANCASGMLPTPMPHPFFLP